MILGIVVPTLVCFAVIGALPVSRATRDAAVTGVLVVAAVASALTGQGPWVSAAMAALAAVAAAVTFRRVAGGGPTSDRDRTAA